MEARVCSRLDRGVVGLQEPPPELLELGINVDWQSFTEGEGAGSALCASDMLQTPTPKTFLRF